ncbi:hypothetical protein AB0K00_06635 [Dactylosporangium sp. NPDC049525]|uniref:hypothetical protein n=1 Tax=Dactylosporangium sp. NPDC049525 TaxID=3154730 RepID=UPI0034394364
MDLRDIEREVAALDAIYRPVATAPVDLSDPTAFTGMAARVGAGLAALGVGERAEAAVRALVEAYAAGDEATRVRIRRLFDRHRHFRWAAHLPRDWDNAAELRARLVHLSARDQGSDTRDEILALQDLCDRARRSGIDAGPVLDEVAAMSSDLDRYGMGSMRDVILRYGRR